MNHTDFPTSRRLAEVWPFAFAPIRRMCWFEYGPGIERALQTNLLPAPQEADE